MECIVIFLTFAVVCSGHDKFLAKKMEGDPGPDHWFSLGLKGLREIIPQETTLSRFLDAVDYNALNRHLNSFEEFNTIEKTIKMAFKFQISSIGFEIEHDPNFQLILGALGDQMPSVLEDLRDLNDALGIPNVRCDRLFYSRCDTPFIQALKGVWKILPLRLLLGGPTKGDKRIVETFRREEIKLAMANLMLSRPVKEARVIASAGGYGFDCFIRAKMCPAF